MSILKEVAAELLSMFVADARQTVATLLLVAAVAALILALQADPLLGGAILFLGCIVIVIEAAVRETRRRGRRSHGMRL
jgi:hypothetical protein